MYGYIKIDKDKLAKGEQGLYHTFLCGICLSNKKLFNNFSRLLSNFDINFFNILFHSYLNKDVEISMTRCVSSPFKQRSVLQPDDITDKLSIANVLLMYLNIKDDCIDEKKFLKKAILRSLLKPYNKAQALASQLDTRLNKHYNDLNKLEEEKCDVLDKVCHPFAKLSEEFGVYMAGENNTYLNNLLYNIGKWVYLIDALDDLAKDARNKQYNPLLYSFEFKGDTKSFVKDNIADLRFVFNTTLNRITQCYNDLNLTKYTCVLNNILYYSLRDKTEQTFNKYLSDK